MKFPMTLFCAFCVAVLFDVRLAASQTAATKKAGPSQSTNQRAMEECKERYGRAWLGRAHVRYAYIEACFKQLTGMYPFQVNVHCIYRATDHNNTARGRDYFC
jgi:hypothetical protein